MRGLGPYIRIKSTRTTAMGGKYFHGTRGGSRIMRGIVSITQDRARYIEDYAAYGLCSAVSSTWRLWHAGSGILVFR